MSRRQTQKITLEQIRNKNGIGRKVAEYIYPFVKRSGLSNQELTNGLKSKSHTNTSMMRSGSANLPIEKVPLLAELIDCDPYMLGYLALQCHNEAEHKILLKLGVITSPDEQEVLVKLNQLLSDKPALDLLACVQSLVAALTKLIK